MSLSVSLPTVSLPLAVTFASTAQAAGVRVVPEGNRNRNQPAIPYSSARRTKSSQSTYDQKFDRIIAVLKRDSSLISKIKRVADRYDIDPIHMIGAIIGEHTYNYDTLDSAQSYYIKALNYAGIPLKFEYDGENVEEFVKRPEFDRCQTKSIQQHSDRRWGCFETVWETKFRNKRVGGQKYPGTNFNETFFQPLFSGQSFGLGQLSPLTVLKMTDRVARQSRNKPLSPSDPKAVYNATMDPDISLEYMAAVIQDAIEAYKAVGKVDISNNPGITATLYNLGDPWKRATRFRRSGATWPSENYYGWLVNDRLEKIRSVL